MSEHCYCGHSKEISPPPWCMNKLTRLIRKHIQFYAENSVHDLVVGGHGSCAKRQFCLILEHSILGFASFSGWASDKYWTSMHFAIDRIPWNDLKVLWPCLAVNSVQPRAYNAHKHTDAHSTEPNGCWCTRRQSLSSRYQQTATSQTNGMNCTRSSYIR